MPEQAHRPQTYTILLLRHGESVGNAQGIHQGQADFPLSDTGRQQARLLAARWQNERTHFDRIIASPLLRARETAEIIAAATGSPVEPNPLWMERNVGLYSGLTPEDGHKKYPPPAFSHIYQPVGKTGESQWELFLRAGSAVQDLINHPPGKYIVISHGGILNLALYAILGIVPQANFVGPRFRFSNTGFATLTYDPADQTWRLSGINDTAHLKTEQSEMVGAFSEANGINAGEDFLANTRELSVDTSQAGVNNRPEYAIRSARTDDVDRLLELFIEANDFHWSAIPDIIQQPGDYSSTRQFLKSEIEGGQTGFYLAEVDGKPVGFIMAVIRTTPDIPVLTPRRYGMIGNLMVTQAYRGRGIGKALMESACDWIRAQGVSDIELNVYEFNQSAISFYERLGYTTLDRTMRKFIPDGKSTTKH